MNSISVEMWTQVKVGLMMLDEAENCQRSRGMTKRSREYLFTALRTGRILPLFDFANTWNNCNHIKSIPETDTHGC